MMYKMLRATSITMFLVALGVSAFAADYYVAPTGTSTNAGTVTSPWSLATALAGGYPAGKVRPGDTLHLAGGLYGTGVGTKFTCKLNGSATAPIIVRNTTGQRATINGGLVISGSYTWIWGLEVTNTSLVGHQRQYPLSGVSDADSKRPVGINFRPGSRYNKAINCIVHDVGRAGIGAWGDEFEIYGNIVYHCGVFDSTAPATPSGDHRRGDAMYANVTSSGNAFRHDVEENIAFRNFNIGWKVYTEWTGQYVDNFIEIGNVSFLHPLWNMTLEDSAHPIKYNVFDSNSTYQRLDSSFYSVKYGYRSDNLTGMLTSNRLASGTFGSGPLLLKGWTNLTNQNNSLASAKLLPSKVPLITVRPNKYEQGRGHVVVYNYGGYASVQVDLSRLGLAAGQSFAVYDAQNPFGAPVFTGTWSGAAISLPMNQTVVAPMVGDVPAPLDMRHTAPYFGAFLVLPGN